MAKRLSKRELINLLFSEVLQPDGRQYSASDVVRATGVSHSFISMLRSGKHTNPSFAAIQQILDFFEVPMAYMDAESVDEAKAIIHNRERYGPHLAVRFRKTEGLDLSPRALQQVETLIQYALAREKALDQGLPPPEPPQFHPPEDEDEPIP